LVGGPPGTALHTVVDGLPSGAVGEIFPVVVMPTGVGMVPNDAAGAIMDVEGGLGTVDGDGTCMAVMEGDGSAGMAGGCGAGMLVPGKSVMNDVAGCADNVSIGAAVLPVAGAEDVAGTADVVGAAEIDDVVPVVPVVDDMEATGTAGVPGVICPVGAEQVTTVPGVAGSEASGTGASVVSAAPGWVVAENGLGPLSGEVTIAPGVDESPMAVVPIVDTWARPALQPNSRIVVANSRRRIAISSFLAI
jgi:hypothetical protein